MLPDIQPGNTKILYFFNCLLDGMHTKEVDGAIYFMSPEVVGAIAEALEDDLYILPSSVNEVLLVRASELEDGVDELKEMVRDANETVVAEKDILSYNVYHYDKEHGITIAA